MAAGLETILPAACQILPPVSRCRLPSVSQSPAGNCHRLGLGLAPGPCFFPSHDFGCIANFSLHPHENLSPHRLQPPSLASLSPSPSPQASPFRLLPPFLSPASAVCTQAFVVDRCRAPKAIPASGLPIAHPRRHHRHPLRPHEILVQTPSPCADNLSDSRRPCQWLFVLSTQHP